MNEALNSDKSDTAAAEPPREESGGTPDSLDIEKKADEKGATAVDDKKSGGDNGTTVDDKKSGSDSGAAGETPGGTDKKSGEKGDKSEKGEKSDKNGKKAGAKDKSSKSKNKSKQSKKHSTWWIKASVLTLGLSAVFSLISEIISTGAHVAVAFVLLSVFLIISIISDMLGIAVASCSPEPFQSMASRKIPGAKTSLSLIKNADKVSSICNDVIGDICGIMSGALSAAIVIKLFSDSNIVAGIVMSSVVAALTVGGKAFFKAFAIKHSHDIIRVLGKILSGFVRKKNR